MLRFCHHVCIETSTYEKSLGFYRDVLGFGVVHTTPDFHGRAFNTWLRNGDILIELQTPKKPRAFPLVRRIAFSLRAASGGIDHICFLVDDIEAETERILKAGHDAFKRKDGGIVYRVSGVALCKVVAPEGTVIELREQDVCF